ncbi:ribose transport system substrate-binding protein [Azotobacter beijerinckii]|uniref:Ribose transport system substrate-binding protein n=1 Tax=Azotobacter beijerinckii TaxID=170623 RepID=A0A1I4EIU7_9GAMM|nr:ribose transport system substrate-binding protein [Azotobacter beijerinckii]SFL04980.1 ribose transport system substrate-binding protein [Azotobacter beijerinckii]
MWHADLPECCSLQGSGLKRPHFFRLPRIAVLLCGLLLAPLASAAPLQFALVAKRVDHRFFILAAEGCAEAAQAQGDSCLLLGAAGPTHFRRQNEALKAAFERGLDGIALSVTHSKWLADHALQRAGKTPLITFDSDLGPAEQPLRKGYVGLDNLLFGQQLGMLAQRFRPQGGRLCILSGRPQDTNLSERIRGIRQQLRGEPAANEAGDRLSGEHGWSEPPRCPLYDTDDQQNALLKLATLMDAGEADVIISTGSWPIHQADTYRGQLGPLLARLDKQGGRPATIIATPEPNAAQLALLDDGLVQAYLSMESREIGRQSYWMMKRLAQGLPVAERVLVESHVYLPGAAPAKP